MFLVTSGSSLPLHNGCKKLGILEIRFASYSNTGSDYVGASVASTVRSLRHHFPFYQPKDVLNILQQMWRALHNLALTAHLSWTELLQSRFGQQW